MGGRVLLIRRQAAEAVQHLEQAVAAEPSDHHACLLLGRTLLLGEKAERVKPVIERYKELKECCLMIIELHI